jgi:D-alanyl-D-alanine carboxypeptidase
VNVHRLRHWIRRTLIGTAACALLTGTLGAGPAAARTHSTTQSTLQQDVNALYASGASGVLAEIVDHGKATYARAGEAFRGTGIPVPHNGRFRIGSETKAYTATVIMQLVGEHRLSLDDRVEKWLPGVVDGNGYNGNNITVRELLLHTSGIFDYTTDSTMQAMLLSAEAFNATRFKHYSADGLIHIALAHPPYFAPGTGYAYSNTNYVLAGKIIQAVTGQSWAAQVTKRIIIPLHLTGTSAPGDNPFIPLPAIGGYNIYTTDPAQRVYTDTTVDNSTWDDAAGSLISTTADENAFYHALFAGRLVSPALLAIMKQGSIPAPSAGIGFGHQTLDCGVEMFGAVGEVPGYTTYVFSTGDGARSVVLALPTTTFSEAQVFYATEQLTFNVVEHAFCPPVGSGSAAHAPRQSSLFHPASTLAPRPGQH